MKTIESKQTKFMAFIGGILLSGKEFSIVNDRGCKVKGRLVGIEREDGSGNCWNLKLYDASTRTYKNISYRIK